MNFMDAVKVCLVEKYADFSGRATRAEYWWFVLFLLVVGLVISIFGSLLSIVFSLATLVPSFAAGARRLHDTGRSGWWQLIWFIPLVGWIVLIILLAQPSQYAAPGAPGEV